MIKRNQQQKGFTLIEIVIALVVLIVGLVGSIAVIPLGQNASKEASVVTRSALVATEKLSELRAYGYDKVSEEPPSFPLTGVKDDIEWEAEISDVLDSDFTDLITLPLQNLKKIKVTVRYQIKQKSHEDTFRTFVAKF